MLAFACLAVPWPASAAFSRCLVFAGLPMRSASRTPSTNRKKSLREAIDKWKADNGITGPVSETAEEPQPHPYWRSEVDPRLLLPPDVVTDAAYTLCWKGVGVTGGLHDRRQDLLGTHA